MQPLSELINVNDPGIVKIREWIAAASNSCEVLPPSERREEVLLETQVTTRSTLGAIVYETGGILIDNAWLRFLAPVIEALTESSNVEQRTIEWTSLGRRRCCGWIFRNQWRRSGSDVKNMFLFGLQIRSIGNHSEWASRTSLCGLFRVVSAIL